MINKFKATCTRCGKTVFPGQGDTQNVNGKWVTSHSPNCPGTNIPIHRGKAPEALKEESAPMPTFEENSSLGFDTLFDELQAGRPDRDDEVPF